MQIKKFILTSALIFTTGTAFGAASVRAPKVSGGAVAPATTIAPVRAGTLRAQTLKTPSVATPATITTSVATPIATESTESRMALSKAFKSLNPKQVKDKAAAQQELDVISDQIQELQAKLDTAKTDQTTVLTESNIDDKIIANVESKTYTKDEINTLLAEIEKKLPKIDDKGNMTWTDPNGNLITNSIYYINLVNQQEHLLVSFVQDQGVVNIPIADIFTYHTNKTDTVIQQYVSTTVCSGETSTWCTIIGITPIGGDVKEVKVLRLRHGGGLVASLPEYYGYTFSDYWTFESQYKQYIQNMACGNLSENECNINTDPNYTQTIDIGESYNLSGQIQRLAIVRVNKLTRYYMDLAHQENIEYIGNYSRYKTNMTTDRIEEQMSSVICPDETPDSGWCVLGNTTENTLFGVPYKLVEIYHFMHGYKPGNFDVINGNARAQNFVTFEDNAEEYILDAVCGERPESECHLYAPTHCQDMSLLHTTRERCSVYIERLPEPGTAWYQQTE